MITERLLPAEVLHNTRCQQALASLRFQCDTDAEYAARVKRAERAARETLLSFTAAVADEVRQAREGRIRRQLTDLLPMTADERAIISETFKQFSPCWRMPSGYLVFESDGDMYLLLSPGRQIERCLGWEVV